jgi:hypothetical protein
MKPAVAAVAKLHGQLEAEIAGGRRRNVLRRIGRRLVEIGGPGLRDSIGALVADGDRGVAVLCWSCRAARACSAHAVT